MTGSWAIRGLTAGYGSRCALEPLDLDLPLGCATTVVGPGGSGKTTLLRALANIERPASMWVRGSALPPPESTVLVPQRNRSKTPVDLLPKLRDVSPRAIIMLDEPFVQTPPPSHEELHQHLQELHGHTILCVTHNLHHSRRLADHVVLLVDGALVESAPADDFFERPQHPRTVDFLETGS